MIIEILQPDPQTINLSTGDKTIAINYRGNVTDLAKNHITLVLEIVSEPGIVFSDGKSTIAWEKDMTKDMTNYLQPQTFHLVTPPGTARFCALLLTATDPDGVEMQSSTHIVYH